MQMRKRCWPARCMLNPISCLIMQRSLVSLAHTLEPQQTARHPTGLGAALWPLTPKAGLSQVLVGVTVCLLAGLRFTNKVQCLSP